jgi:hypothetical protein
MAITATGLSGSSVEYYARISAEQETIKDQAASLESAAERVKASVEVFSPAGMFVYLYESNKSSSAFRDFSVNALRRLVNSYNELNETSAASDRLSDEGKALLDKVKSLLSGPSGEKLRKIGIGLDKATGALRFDEQRFADALLEDPDGVRGLLLNKKGLEPVIQQTIDNMLAQSATSYFNASFVINA